MMNLQEHFLILGDNPYWVFISFLYSWIAAEIAGRFSKDPYQLAQYERRERRWRVALIRSHLLLASFVVGTSWLAWTQAFADGQVTAPEAVLSRQSLLLIVDFVILVMYFSLVSIVGDERKSGHTPRPAYPSWKHSSYWVWWILAAYALWDGLTYFYISRSTGSPTHFWAHSWMSVFCAVLASLAFVWLRRIRADRPLWVLAGDVSLTALILFYRALKQLAHTSAPPVASFPCCLTNSPPPASEHAGQLTENGLHTFAFITFFVFICLGFVAGIVGRRPVHIEQNKT
jgi:hypothetical protein